MSGIASDVRAGAEGSVSPASDALTQPVQPELPTASPENLPSAQVGTAVQSEGGSTGISSPDAELTGEEALRQEFEAQFASDKAALESGYHKQINSLQLDVLDRADQNYTLQRKYDALEAQFKAVFEKYGGDEGDLAIAQVAAQQAGDAASQETARARESVDQWFNRQQTEHERVLAAQSVDATTGQRLFDVNDPEIKAAFDSFVPLGLQAMRGGGPALQQSATREFENLQALIARKREDGLRALAGASRTPEQNRALDDQRGPMNRGDGTNASVTDASLLEEARARFPKDRIAQAAFFSQQRRVHGLSG